MAILGYDVDHLKGVQKARDLSPGTQIQRILHVMAGTVSIVPALCPIFPARWTLPVHAPTSGG